MLAIYTRLSKEDDESNSIKNQLREAKEYVDDNKIIQYRVYNEGEGFSGTRRIKERPKLNELMQDIEAGLITSVWMRRQDRLARLGVTVLTFADAVIKNNVYLNFGDKGHVDLTDPIQMFHLTVMAGVDALKPAQQSKATKKAIRDNFAEGLTHGKRTFGFTSVNRKLIIDKDEAKIVKYIYMLSLNGMGTKKIAELLNEEEILTQYQRIAEKYEKDKLPLELSKITPTYKVKNKYTGKIQMLDKSESTWKDGTVYGILTNEIYKGVRKLTVGKDRDGKKIFEYFSNTPIIIKPHIWQQVQENLSKNKTYGGKQQIYEYLLKGLMRCGKCGKNYYGRTRASKKDNYYMCSSKRYKDSNCGNRSINIDFLDRLMWDRLFANDGFKTKIKDYFKNNETQQKIQQLQETLQRITKSLENLNKQKKNVMRFSDNENINEVMDDVNDEINRAKIEKEQKQRELISLQSITQNQEEYLKDLNQMNENLPFVKKVELVNKFIGEIVIHDWFKERRAFAVAAKLKLDAELNELFIIDYAFRYVINFSNKNVELTGGKYLKMSKNEQEEAKRYLYHEKFMIQDVNQRADTLEDLEALKHEFD